MAHVTLTDGREVDVEDGNPSLLDYYRGEGATVVGVAETVRFPVVFENGERVDPPEPPVVVAVDRLSDSSEQSVAAGESLGVALDELGEDGVSDNPTDPPAPSKRR